MTKHFLPDRFVDPHNKISVVVAGAGGNGSQVLSGLARMQVALESLGHPGFDVEVFDPDEVTEANVGRQLFSPSDIGCNKAAALVNRINHFFGFDWQARAKAFPDGVHTTVDILISCVDSAAARRALGKSRFWYWLDLGNSQKTGQVILGTFRRNSKEGREKHPRMPTVLEFFPELKNRHLQEDTSPSCSLAQALERQDLFINQSVSTFALQLLWQFFRNGALTIHGYFINLQTGRVTPLPIPDPTQKKDSHEKHLRRTHQGRHSRKRPARRRRPATR